MAVFREIAAAFRRPGVRAWIAPGALIAAAFAYFNYVSWTQYASNHFFLVDIGVNDLAISGTLRGEFFRSPIGDWPYFAVHFKPILLLFLPLYVFFDHPMTLAAGYNLALAGAAAALWALARERTGDARLALAFAAAWLFSHWTLSLHLSLHPESLAMPGFFLLFLTQGKKRAPLYWAALAWVLANKEDMALYLAFYGLYLAFWAREPDRRRGLLTTAVCIAWLLLALGVMAWLRPAGETYKGGEPALARYASLGGGWGEIALHSLTHPLEIARRIFARPALWVLLGSLLFLPLLAPRTLPLLLPGALVFLASDSLPQQYLYHYYSYAMLPFAFFGAVKGAALLRRRFPRWSAPALITGLLFTAALGMLAPTRSNSLLHRPFRVLPRHRMIRELLREHLPPDARVAAQYDLFCQIPRRPLVLPLWPENMGRVNYAAVDKKGFWPDLTLEECDTLADGFDSPDWRLVVSADDFYLLEYAPAPPPPSAPGAESRPADFP